METLPALLGFLLALALALLALAKYQRRRSGLPEGEVIYEDASGLASAPLSSKRANLTGKPDYLLRDPEGNLIPVEVKSGDAPPGGLPYESHVMQLAVYFFLIEDALKSEAPYGLIRYRNRTVRVNNTDQLRRRLFAALAQMRSLLARGEAHRDHEQASRCARCSMIHACDERLG
jgi:CRISPR-associated exonuclease Cas4